MIAHSPAQRRHTHLQVDGRYWHTRWRQWVVVLALPGMPMRRGEVMRPDEVCVRLRLTGTPAVVRVRSLTEAP